MCCLVVVFALLQAYFTTPSALHYPHTLLAQEYESLSLSLSLLLSLALSCSLLLSLALALALSLAPLLSRSLLFSLSLFLSAQEYEDLVSPVSRSSGRSPLISASGRSSFNNSFTTLPSDSADLLDGVDVVPPCKASGAGGFSRT